MAKWNVYISSTFIDLKEFRVELIRLFENQLHNNFELSKIMERMFDDGTCTPFVEDCIKAVANCDIYIIILGNRAGSFPPGEDRTYTEIELDTALENSKRIFFLRLAVFDDTKIDHKEKHDEMLNKFEGRFTHTFRDVTELKNALYDCLIPLSSQLPVNTRNPYKGLSAFGVKDGDYFFGRDAELETCLKKIVTSEGNVFVSVIGNSGTGKSSFVQAGLLFRLKYGKTPGFSKHPQIIVTPGSEPFTNLTYQLHLQGLSPEDILSGNAGVILFFDQFEEIIIQCQAPEAQKERKQLFSFLDALTDIRNKHSKIIVICAFRSDFLSQLVNYEYIRSHQYLFPLSSLDYELHATNWAQSIREIITKPALKNEVEMEEELVDQLLNQLKEVEGALPILQFTLEQVWSRKTIEDRRISATEYSEMSEGKGIAGIIEAHAEDVIKNITGDGEDKEKEAVLKSIFVNLVEVNENLRDVKKTVTKDELFHILKAYPEHIVNEVFEVLVSEKSRLLHISWNKDETVNVNIIHEALIRKWERLKSWINERREALERKKRIIHDIEAYHKGEEGLYRGRKLKIARRWKSGNPDLSNDTINTFLLKAKKSKTHRLYKLSAYALFFFVLLLATWLTVLAPFINKKSFLANAENYKTLNDQIAAADGHINSVTDLTINDNNYRFLNKNKNIRYFKNLERLNIKELKEEKDLTFLQHMMSDPDRITSLTIKNNVKLNSLAGIEKFTKLDSLTIESNYNLTGIDSIAHLINLKSLAIINNFKLSSLKSIETLDQLRSLIISSNYYLTSLKGIETLVNVKSLNITSNAALASLAGIEKLANLKSLSVAYNDRLTSLGGIKALSNLKSLTIMSNDSLISLAGVENLPNLNSLKITHNKSLTSIKEIEKFTQLTSLNINSNHNLKSLAGIKALSNLKTLTIMNNDKLASLAGIKNLKNLDSLTVKYNKNQTSLAGTGNLTNIPYRSIDHYKNPAGSSLPTIEGNNSLINLKTIEKPTDPDSLIIKNNNELLSLEGIETLVNLTSLTIENNKKLFSLKGIENLKALRFLSIGGNHPDLNPEILYELTQLEELQLSYPNYLGVDIQRIKRNNPGIKIIIESNKNP